MMLSNQFHINIFQRMSNRLHRTDLRSGRDQCLYQGGTLPVGVVQADLEGTIFSGYTVYEGQRPGRHEV